jgi:hypothetical protein
MIANAGDLIDIQVSVIVKKDRVDRITLSWQSDSFAKEIIPRERLWHTLCAETAPLTVTVGPLDTHPDHVVITGDIEIAIAGVEETVYLRAYDELDNMQSHQSDVFSLTATHQVSGASVSAVVTPVSNSYYEAKYTLPSSGSYDMDITVQPNGSGSALNVRSLVIQ